MVTEFNVEGSGDTGEIGYGDMFQVSNPQAKRMAEAGAAGGEVKQAAGFFDNYRQMERNSAALSEARSKVANMREVMSFKARNFSENEELKNKLFAMDQAAASNMLDRELEFKRDAAGRAFMSERQMMDWMSTKALKDQDWQNYANMAQLESDRRIQVLEASYRKIEAMEKQSYERYRQGISQDAQKTIAAAKANLKRKIADEEAKMKNRSAMVGALSTVGMGVGGVVGAGYGGPAGAAAGSAGGGLAGAWLGSQLGGK